MTETVKPSPEPKATAAKQRISQTVIPAYSLEKALLIARAIVDNFGGRSGEPNQIALAMNWTPTGGSWRALTGSAIAYGITEGGYGASEIKLSSRGSAIVAPTEENGDKLHLRAAILEPTMMRAFIERYDNAKFPSKEIGINVLASLGLPRERCPEAFDLIEENLKYVGALAATKTGQMVLLSTITQPLANSKIDRNAEKDEVSVGATSVSAGATLVATGHVLAPPTPHIAPPNYKVFISYSKADEALVETVKKAVSYGRLTPVVARKYVDNSNVPHKIIEEMLSCFGGIVQIRNESEWQSLDGKRHLKINENTLIELGAAMAIYGDNLVLLVERGTRLPSNLRDLPACHYEPGGRLDADSLMQLMDGLLKFKPRTE